MQKLKESVQKMAYGNEFVVDNVKYSQGDRVGSGGNGTVFDLIQLSDISAKELVVKRLKVNRQNPIKEQRKKRFEDEINTVVRIQGEVAGILPILKSNCEGDNYWYVMPKAISCNEKMKSSDITIKSKVEILLELANTIKNLHERGLFHRDIKPGNILFLGDKPYLSDFGLVFNGVDDRNTDTGESVGPYLIRPPELETEASKMTEFSKSDVYLFAKTAWMIIRGDDRGFRGPYNRKYGIYLKKNLCNVRTLEPLHCMMEAATVDEYDNRITIEKCIEYLNEQLSVITNESGNIDRLEYEENIKEIANNIEPSELSYVDTAAIHSILKGTGTKILMTFSEELFKGEVYLKYIGISGKKEDRIFLFRDDIEQEIIMKIETVTIKKDRNLVIVTGDLERQVAYESISALGRSFFVKPSGKYAVYKATEIECTKP